MHSSPAQLKHFRSFFFFFFFSSHFCISSFAFLAFSFRFSLFLAQPKKTKQNNYRVRKSSGCKKLRYLHFFCFRLSSFTFTKISDESWSKKNILRFIKLQFYLQISNLFADFQFYLQKICWIANFFLRKNRLFFQKISAFWWNFFIDFDMRNSSDRSDLIWFDWIMIRWMF